MHVLAGCHSRVRPLTREPLLHFAAIGLALFVARPVTPPSVRELTDSLFLFGLLHGLGFAGALSGAGLPRAAR